MTDEQIIKALVTCKTPSPIDCRNCQYKGKTAPMYITPMYISCHNLLLEDTLDLINQQIVKIETLEYDMQLLKQEKKFIENQAIKEFAERLKAIITINNTDEGHLDYSIDYNCLIEDIDALVREMTEGKDNA